MTDDLNKTVRLRLPRKKGGSGSAEEDHVETEVELISTQELHMLLVDNDDRRKDLESVADGKDGVLARHVDSDRFEIVDEDDVAAALARAEESRPLDVTSTELVELSEDDAAAPSLVSTMMLKSILGPDGDVELFLASDKNTDRKK